jgi:NAD(P)-dependent dehydrogenase (short-subunit alcohol dehydrogenase family)
MPEPAGQTIVITGAGAGIGRALTVGFVGRGAHVVAVGRGMRGLEETKDRCAGPGTVECQAVDVTDAAALEQMFGVIVRARGGVDLLINGAAVYPRVVLGEIAAEVWNAGVSTNLSGVAYGCRAAIRTFPPNRRAVILNLGSFAYLGPEPASTLYCATKAAVSAFTRALAVELASNGSSLIVNEWVPGIYRTRMSGDTGEDPALAFVRLLTVWEVSQQGAGGRTFERDNEVLPPRSLRSRLKSLLTGRRT